MGLDVFIDKTQLRPSRANTHQQRMLTSPWHPNTDLTARSRKQSHSGGGGRHTQHSAKQPARSDHRVSGCNPRGRALAQFKLLPPSSGIA